MRRGKVEHFLETFHTQQRSHVLIICHVQFWPKISFCLNYKTLETFHTLQLSSVLVISTMFIPSCTTISFPTDSGFSKIIVILGQIYTIQYYKVLVKTFDSRQSAQCGHAALSFYV